MFQSSFGSSLDSFMHYSYQGTAENFLIIPPEQLELLDSIPGWSSGLYGKNPESIVKEKNRKIHNVSPKASNHTISPSAFSPYTVNYLNDVINSHPSVHLKRKCSSLSDLKQISEVPVSCFQDSHMQSAVDECIPLLSGELITRHCRSLPNIAIPLHRKSSSLFPGMKRFCPILEQSKHLLSQQKELILKESRARMLGITRNVSPTDDRILRNAIRYSSFVSSSKNKRSAARLETSHRTNSSLLTSQRTETDLANQHNTPGINQTYRIQTSDSRETHTENPFHCSSYRIGDETQQTCLGIVNNEFVLSGSSECGIPNRSQGGTTQPPKKQSLNSSRSHTSSKVVSSTYPSVKLESSYELFNSQEDQVPSSQLSDCDVPAGRKILLASQQTKTRPVEVINLEDGMHNNNAGISSVHPLKNGAGVQIPELYNFRNFSRRLFTFSPSQVMKMTNIIYEIYK